MSKLIRLVSMVVILNLGASVFADTSSFLGGVVGALITSNNQTQHTKHTSTRKAYKRKSSIPKDCSSERWVTHTLENKQNATNYQGILVSYDDMGETLIKLAIKTAIPSMFKSGDVMQVTVKFSKGERFATGKIDQEGKNILISGMDAIYITNKLKSSSYVKIDFVNNKYCTRLKGSSKSIQSVVSAAAFYKNNRPNYVQEARLSRAVTAHTNHAMRVASNQKEFAEKVVGIRPKSDLDKADGNIYDSKIQYYKPGSEEIGEMWVDWYIDDEKGPLMRLNFMDPTHQYENKTHIIKISLMPIEVPCNIDLKIKSDASTSPSCKIVKNLLRADKWGKIAKEKEMKRQFTKKVSYIQGDEKSKISLSINFKVYEDGAMSAQVEHMKYGFPNRFNFTLTNALELANYIEKTRKKAHKKWLNKTRTTEELDALFD